MTRPFGAALLALAMLSSGCLPTRARVLAASPVPGLEVSIDEAFYRVAGLTASDLNRELRDRAVRHEGVRWQGLTDFRVPFTFTAGSKDGASTVTITPASGGPKTFAAPANALALSFSDTKAVVLRTPGGVPPLRRRIDALTRTTLAASPMVRALLTELS